MITNTELGKYLDDLLSVNLYSDYAPNGLQIEGTTEIRKIICGVTASKDLIKQAIEEKADAIIVHHGYFWKSESPVITGIKKERIKLLLENNINLYGYHLPLDCHESYGNNSQLAEMLGIRLAQATENRGLIWVGEVDEISADMLANHINDVLGREPQLIKGGEHLIKKVAWCTGGAQNYIEKAAILGVDAYISGEVSEQTYHLARECGVHYYAAGHHATERYGIKKISEVLNQELSVESHFIEIYNPV